MDRMDNLSEAFNCDCLDFMKIQPARRKDNTAAINIRYK